MASGVFINQINEMMKLYLVTSGADLRCKLCMSNCSAATEMLTNAANIDDIVTEDESDDSTYGGAEALTTPASTLDDPNNRGEFTDSGAVAVTFAGLAGDATRNYTGVLLYEHVDGTDANDIPIAWIEFGTPVAKESTSVTVTWNAEGIIQGANA